MNDEKVDEYLKCDISDMLIILAGSDFDDNDEFWKAWDIMIKNASPSELLDGMNFAYTLTDLDDNRAHRVGEMFGQLRIKQPFEDIYAQIMHMKEDISRYNDEALSDELEFREWVWRMFTGMESVISTFFPRMERLFKSFREDAKSISGYNP